MSREGKGIAGKLALGAGAFACVALVPSAVAAFGDGIAAQGGFAIFTPASIDPRVAEIVARRTSGESQMMRFTPANAASWNDGRMVTAAVRLDSQSAQAISDLVSSESAREAMSSPSRLRIAPTPYNLGLALGYRSFAQAPALSSSLSNAEIPDLAEFAPSPGAREEPSRFAARVELERERPSVARDEEQSAQIGDQLLDVGGSFRLTRNLDVTAGIRYEQDRALRPLPDLDKQDNQAVYVGTQFRF